MVDKDFLNKEHLLFVACLLMSDEPSKSIKKLVTVYDTEDGDRLVGIFNSAKTCGKILGAKQSYINSVVNKKILFNSRYRIERLVLDDED